MDFIRILFSILLPPLGVFFQVGLGSQFWINIVLTLLGYIPGVVHAVYIIGSRSSAEALQKKTPLVLTSVKPKVLGIL